MPCPNCKNEEIEHTTVVAMNAPRWYIYENEACWFRIIYCPYCGVKLEDEC